MQTIMNYNYLYLEDVQIIVHCLLQAACCSCSLSIHHGGGTPSPPLKRQACHTVPQDAGPNLLGATLLCAINLCTISGYVQFIHKSLLLVLRQMVNPLLCCYL